MIQDKIIAALQFDQSHYSHRALVSYLWLRRTLGIDH